MKLIYISWLLLALLLNSCGSNSPDSIEGSTSYSTSSTSAEDDGQDSEGDSVQGRTPDGDFDCSATNTSRGNGPYTLGCEKYGGDVTIHFNNGGHLTVDEDGYDSNTGEYWDVEPE